MKKKLVLAFLMATLFAGGAFAQFSLSAGGGALLVPSFSRTKAGSVSDTISNFDFGVNGFFDATYAELNVGLLFGKMDMGSVKLNTMTLTFGLLGKFPFSVSDNLVIFPFAGIDYNVGLSAKSGDVKLPNMGDFMNALSVVFGGGVDFSITESLYIRGEVGFGITFNTRAQKTAKDVAALTNTDYSTFNGKIPIKIAVGYRF